MKPRRPHLEVIEGPAKLHDGHAQDRELSATAGGPRGFRNNGEHPLSLAYAKGQLANDGRHTAAERFSAGDNYREIFERTYRSGRDSTQMDVVSSGGGTIVTHTQAEAVKMLISVDSHMPTICRSIIRRVCGEGWWPSEAVREACGNDYTKATIPRFREALDSLIEAFTIAHRSRYAVNLSNLAEFSKRE